MKKQALIFLLFLIAFLSFSKAQSLDFSQVKTVSLAEDTVPPGKVWKVEAYWQSNTIFTSSTQSGSCSSSASHHPFYINGSYYFKFDGSPGTGSSTVYAAVSNTFPLWLPEGYRLRTECANDFLSIIEFSVTP